MDDDDDKNIKKIIIIEDQQKNKCQQNKIKKINCEKEKKMRVETKSWGLNEDELSYERQFNSLQKILINDNDDSKISEEKEKDKEKDKDKNKYISKLRSHIKTKLCSYKQQDIIKKKLNENKFVSFEETVDLLKKYNLKCCYCSEDVYILYERVREMKQWSLDRINNDIGHNSGNLVIACLECNLKRRRTNKDAFMFTKNMIIIKEN